MPLSDRADLYALLAESLAEPPDWMSLPGREWPLFETLAGLASEFEPADRYLDRLVGIPAEEPRQRQKRYTAIFASGKPRLWLYESAALTGKILGPGTFEIARLYQAAGLEIVGAELPDHISLELTFLSHLVGSSQEIGFLNHHGAWMIDLGHLLSHAGDKVYAPIGGLLAEWLEFALASPHLEDEKIGGRVPNLPNPDDCTLCGFCSQVCPTRVLKIVEDKKSTSLVFNASGCVHCSKCEQVCEFHALNMIRPQVIDARPKTLRQSPLIQCPTCGHSVVSQAEMDYIVSQIGEAAWQNLCLDCRSGLYV